MLTGGRLSFCNNENAVKNRGAGGAAHCRLFILHLYLGYNKPTKVPTNSMMIITINGVAGMVDGCNHNEPLSAAFFPSN